MDTDSAKVSPVEVLLNAIRSGNPLDAAMSLALEQVLGAGLPLRTDEETTTAAFLGALIANLSWTTQACPAQNDAIREASWSVHRKSQGEGPTESRTGVDFGLAIKHSENDVRLALFQAKRGHRDSVHRYYVDVRRPPKDVDGTTATQMMRLVETGLTISQKDKRKLDPKLVDAIPPKYDVLSPLDWVHYLGFFAREFRAIPLKHCGHAWLEERSRSESRSFNDVELTVRNSVRLQRLMAAALQDKPTRSKGWISLTQVDLNRFLPDLVPIMDVYVVDDGRSDWPLQLLTKPTAGFQDQQLDRRSLEGERKQIRAEMEANLAEKAKPAYQKKLKR